MPQALKPWLSSPVEVSANWGGGGGGRAGGGDLTWRSVLSSAVPRHKFQHMRDLLHCAVVVGLPGPKPLVRTLQASDGGNAEELPDLSQEQHRILDHVM